MKIGFFDSGLGGLIVLKAVTKVLPDYDYEFYGDTAHLPYGDKNEEEILKLTKIGIKHLFDRECVLVVVACNTASAETLHQIQNNFLKNKYSDRRVLGVIIPTIEELVSSKINNALLVATTRTVESGKYERELLKIPNSPHIISIATPELVPLIEAGDVKTALNLLLDKIYKAGNIEGLILGCTHYSLFKNELRATFPNMHIFSQDEIVPKKLQNYLLKHNEIETKLSRSGKRNIYLTSNDSSYNQMIGAMLGGTFISD